MSDRPRDKALRGPRERGQEPERQDRATEDQSRGAGDEPQRPSGAADKALDGPREQDAE